MHVLNALLGAISVVDPPPRSPSPWYEANAMA